MEMNQGNEILYGVSSEQSKIPNKKMKECKTCGNMIAKSAKRCPACGAKNKKKFYKRKRFWIMMIILLLIIGSSISPDNKDTSAQYNNEQSSDIVEPTLYYRDIYVGDEINTSFVSITIDEIATAETIYSINSNVVFNSDPGDVKVYVKGTITNTSSSSYDIGGMGSAAYSVKTYLDAEMELSNGGTEYGVLLVDNGGTYGLISDGYLSPYDSVTYYIVFDMNESYYNTYNKGEITLAFTENFALEPSYNRDNCDYLYRINY